MMLSMESWLPLILPLWNWRHLTPSLPGIPTSLVCLIDSSRMCPISASRRFQVTHHHRRHHHHHHRRRLLGPSALEFKSLSTITRIQTMTSNLNLVELAPLFRLAERQQHQRQPRPSVPDWKAQQQQRQRQRQPRPKHTLSL